MFSENAAIWCLYILGGLFLGSIMFCQLIPKVFLGKDITAISGDHNPGATNVFIHCGPTWGMLCLSLDILKGFLPVFLSFHYLDHNNLWFAAVMAAPVVGHALAPMNHFKGGKCIATAFGCLLGTFPLTHIVLVLAGIYIVFSTVLKIDPDRIRSIAAFGLFALVSLISLLHQGQYSIAIGCCLISLVAIFKHSKYFVSEACTTV